MEQTADCKQPVISEKETQLPEASISFPIHRAWLKAQHKHSNN